MKIKALAFALLSLILLSGCTSHSDKLPAVTTENDRPENGVYYEYSDGGGSDRINAAITYENGKEIKRNEYDYWDDGKLKTIVAKENDTVTDTWNYNYSPEGILSQMVRQYTEDGCEYKDDYRYDNKGKLTGISIYEDGEFCGGQRFSYNEKGDTTLEEVLDANGDVITYTEYVFDDSGKTVSSNQYMYGSKTAYSSYEYDEKGILLSISYYGSSDALTRRVVNEYDEKGNIKKVLTYSPEGVVVSYTECLYDDDGFNYRDIYYVDGRPVYRYDYTKDGARIYSDYN